jgi:DNA polymerase-3 subunit alpha
MDFSVVARTPLPTDKKNAPKKVIRFGLSAVKGVGEGAVESVLEVRAATGAFKSIFDFCERVDLRRCNKKVLEALVKSGAFDGLHPNRAQLMAALDTATERAQKLQKEKESGQTSLFGLFGGPPASNKGAAAGPPVEKAPDLPRVEEWAPKQKLAFEKESLGFYISGHPLDRYKPDLERFRATPASEVETKEDRSEIFVGGVVVDFRERPLKSGNGRMAFFKIEDHTGQAEVVCFSKPFAEFEDALKSDEPLLITGTVAIEGEGDAVSRRIHMKEATRIAELRGKKTKLVVVEVNADELTAEKGERLREALERYKGNVPTILKLVVPFRSKTEIILPQRYAVTPSDELLLQVERVLGPKAISLR